MGRRVHSLFEAPMAAAKTAGLGKRVVFHAEHVPFGFGLASELPQLVSVK